MIVAAAVEAPVMKRAEQRGNGMMNLAAKFRIIAGALALLALAISAQPASAQQPVGQS